MSALRKLQHEFLGYLLDDGHQNIIEQIESTPKRSAGQRMALYGDAYVLRLKEALGTDYERLHAYLGDELFDELMHEYIEHYPSHHTSLRYFGQHMPKHLEQSEMFKPFPEVAEIARIEQAFANSFDAKDCNCVSLTELKQLAPGAWVTLSMQFHDAVQLIPLKNNSFQIWQALADETTPPEKIAEESVWLIWRQDLVSRYRALDNAELAALQNVMAGGNFSEMCDTLLHHFSEQETPLKAVGYLQQWINDQMVSGILT